jgi:hypothetical protein
VVRSSTIFVHVTKMVMFGFFLTTIVIVVYRTFKSKRIHLHEKICGWSCQCEEVVQCSKVRYSTVLFYFN